MSLFYSTDISIPREPDPEQNRSMSIEHKIMSSVANTKKDLSAKLGPIEMGSSYHIVSNAEWSLHDVLALLLEKTGPADVWITTWAISENPVREILQLLDAGLIRALNCLFDSRIKSQCPDAYQLIKGNFKRIGLTDIHAKQLVIINDSWAISVSSSANMTNKRRIEKYVICCDRAAADFDREWIEKGIENAFDL